MKILITGDHGFVGSATKRALEKLEHEVIGFDILDKRDVRNQGELERVVKETAPDRMLHLAAIARFADADHDPIQAFETNGSGSRAVSRVAAFHNIPVVYASTGSVYMPIHEAPPITEHFRPCGNSVYGCSKYVGELYIRQSRAPWIILRYAHLYGAEKRMHGLIGGFLNRIQRGLAPTLYGGLQSNDFTYIADVVKANILALTASWEKWNQIYNIGTGEELTTEAAAEAICEVFDYHGAIEKKEQRTVDPARFVFDISKAKSQLGFVADYTFRQGLEAMKREMGIL